MELPGKRRRGRPKTRFIYVMKEDMAEVEVTEEDTVDRNVILTVVICDIRRKTSNSNQCILIGVNISDRKSGTERKKKRKKRELVGGTGAGCHTGWLSHCQYLIRWMAVPCGDLHVTCA